MFLTIYSCKRTLGGGGGIDGDSEHDKDSEEEEEGLEGLGSNHCGCGVEGSLD